jgi:hypothetical protein
MLAVSSNTAPVPYIGAARMLIIVGFALAIGADAMVHTAEAAIQTEQPQ